MDIYKFLLEKNNFPTDKRAFLVYYYPQPGELHKGIPFDTTVIELKTNPARAMTLLKEAKLVLDRKDPPKALETCAFCAWKQVKV